MRFSTKCWSEHILSAYKATKDLKHPLYMTLKVYIKQNKKKPSRRLSYGGCGGRSPPIMFEHNNYIPSGTSVSMQTSLKKYFQLFSALM